MVLKAINMDYSPAALYESTRPWERVIKNLLCMLAGLVITGIITYLIFTVVNSMELPHAITVLIGFVAYVYCTNLTLSMYESWRGLHEEVKEEPVKTE